MKGFNLFMVALDKWISGNVGDVEECFANDELQSVYLDRFFLLPF